jgi:hypothetical protein
MPVHFSWWDAEKRIIYYKFERQWSWDEVYDAFQASWDDARQLDHIVDSISDLTLASSSIPPSAITHVRSLGQKRPANTGFMIVVGASTYARVAMQSFQKIFETTLRRDMQIQFARTIDEALSFLAEKQAERSA